MTGLFHRMGLVGAAKGEDRINWALLRIIDVLMRLVRPQGKQQHKAVPEESQP